MTTLTRDSVLWALAHRKGADNGARAADLVQEICGDSNPAHERKLRAIVEVLRRDGEHVCGHPSTGYYLAACDAELIQTCDFLYHRAMTTLAQVAAMQRVSLPDLRGQMRLPT